jgi:hypothetical protein
MAEQFDVFLAHSSKDKPLIRQIYQELKQRGMHPWLDEEEIAPGTQFQDEIQQAIGQIKVAAICIGQTGLGRWQKLELKSFISQCVTRNIPVIPVLLPGVEAIPDELPFLKEFHAVLFEGDIRDERAFYKLEWGITGVKPQAPQTGAQSPPRPAPTPPPEPEVELKSDKGIDYRELQRLLKAKKWQEADLETWHRMLEAVGRAKNDWIRPEELQTFPCADLRTIDQLWVHYSHGKWGFSVQKQIYVECGAKLDGKYPGDEIWREFCRRVGWRKGDAYLDYSDLTFELQNSSTGEFPALALLEGWVWVGGVCLWWGWVVLFSRIQTCKL